MQQYVTLAADTSINGNTTILNVHLNAVKSDLIVGDPITWSILQNTNRYQGSVSNVSRGENGVIIQICTEPEDWARVQEEAGMGNDKLSVTVDVPTGEQTVKQRIFSGRRGSE